MVKDHFSVICRGYAFTYVSEIMSLSIVIVESKISYCINSLLMCSFVRFFVRACCRESEAELRRVMKTVSDSFAECRRVASPSDSPPEGATRSSSAASDVSSTSDLMEHFMSELDLVFSDIMAEEVSSDFHYEMYDILNMIHKYILLNIYNSNI